MKAFKTFALQTLVVLALFSCNDSATKQGVDKVVVTADSSKPIEANKNVATPSAKENTMSVTAKFIEFSLGDVSHYIFKDKAGKDWDFTDCRDTSYTFAVELPKNKANETNQGWASDKKLQGKWFDIKYVNKDGRELTNGNMDSIAVILEAKIKE